MPQIRTPWLPHPLLATNLTSMDPEHISWTGNHGRHNICSVSDTISIQNKVVSLSILLIFSVFILSSHEICQAFRQKNAIRSSAHAYSTLTINERVL